MNKVFYRSSLLGSIILSLLLLSSCAPLHQSTQKTTADLNGTKTGRALKKQYFATAPESILILEKIPQHHPYKVIGHLSVKEYNWVGVKRQEAVINDILKKQAAELGGNAIIGMHQDNHQTTAEVIRFVG